MAKVKIIFTSGGDWDCYAPSVVADMTDWDEVTDDELVFLKTNACRIKSPVEWYNTILVVQDEVPIQERISTIRQFLAKEEGKRLAEKERRERAKLEKARQKAAEERKKYEALRAKFEGSNV